MPVYLRNFYLRKLVDTKKKEREQIDKSQSKSSGINKPPSKISNIPSNFRK